MIKKILLLVIIIFFSSAIQVNARECSEKNLILVNPVRGRELWIDTSTQPIVDQYDEITKYGFPATWLLQYDAVTDDELIRQIMGFDEKHEIGLFVEVSPRQAADAGVIYPPHVQWYDPEAVFLSGYERSERRRLIDKLYSRFNDTFGYYPIAIGAWWIDSYSLNYIERKYGVKSVMIVADQKTTDNYGVWGQWWGVPYVPSRTNILVPANNEATAHDFAVIQWAQRDPDRAYGAGKEYSNYSLQANDYTERGLNTDYFKYLTDVYLDCQLPIRQITIGLETGMEGVTAFPEYQRQLSYLSTLKPTALTMSDFAEKFTGDYFSLPQKIILAGDKSSWVMTKDSRANEVLGDYVAYEHRLAFSDSFISDNAGFLQRTLPVSQDRVDVTSSRPFYLAVFLLFLVLYYRKSITDLWIPSALFVHLSYAHILRISRIGGWRVYYASDWQNFELVQVLFALGLFVVVYGILRLAMARFTLPKLLAWLMPLTFFADFVLFNLRYSFIDSKHMLGFMPKAQQFVGAALTPNGIRLLSSNFPPAQAGAFLRIDMAEYLSDHLLASLAYPLVHLALALFMYLLFVRIGPKARVAAIAVIAPLTILLLYQLATSDPLGAVLAKIN